MMFIIGLFFIFILFTSTIKIVRQSQVFIVERLGKFRCKAETGINFLIPFIDRVAKKIDLREQVADFPPQAVITKDNVTIQIDTVVYFQITDPQRFTYEINDPRWAIENLTATTLRNIIGELELDSTLTSRDIINTRLRAVLDEATDKWGIKVNRVELKNILPPKDIQDAMEKQMRAEREKRKAILDAEGQKEAAILRAQGNKESAILSAQAEKEAAIQRAEGEKQSRILEAEGEAAAILAVQSAKAEGIKTVYAAIKDSKPNKELIAIRSLEAMEKVADGNATKLIVPTEAMSILGALAGAKEIFTKDGAPLYDEYYDEEDSYEDEE